MTSTHMFCLLLVLAGGGLSWWAQSTINSYHHLRKRGISTNATVRDIVLREDTKGHKDYWLTILYPTKNRA